MARVPNAGTTGDSSRRAQHGSGTTVSFSLPPLVHPSPASQKAAGYLSTQKRNRTFVETGGGSGGFEPGTKGVEPRTKGGAVVDSESVTNGRVREFKPGTKRGVTFEPGTNGAGKIGFERGTGAGVARFEPGTAAGGDAGTMSSALYRSVPPRPLSYTFSDVMEASLNSRGPSRKSKSRSKTAPVSTNAPEEYAERFKSRPTTRPAVIDFNGTTVKLRTARSARQPYLGFPPVKLTSKHVPGSTPARSSAPEVPMTERGTTATSTLLHLAPLAKGADPDAALALQTRPYGRPPPPLYYPTPKQAKTPELSRFHGMRSAASSIKSRAKSSSSSQRATEAGTTTKSATTRSQHRLPQTSNSDTWPGELSSSKLSTLDALGFTVTMSSNGEGLCLPDALARSEDYDDLSELPRPKRILPRRDVPWVFRFKVKKEMNALARIMASKPHAVGPVTAAGPTA